MDSEDATLGLSQPHRRLQKLRRQVERLPCGTQMAGEWSETGWKSGWCKDGLAQVVVVGLMPRQGRVL